jgi:hypothetical protein
MGTQEYRLSIPVFRNSGGSRPTSGDCPNKSLTRHHAAAVSEVPPEMVAVPMISLKRGVRNEPSPELMLVSPIFRDLPILPGRVRIPVRHPQPAKS